MQEPNYSAYAGSSPSPSPAYPPGSHLTSNPESQPFLPAPLYPPASKSVLSYMGATSPMSNSSLLSGQPPSPTWQSSSPSTGPAVQEGQLPADSHHSAYSRLTGFGNSMGSTYGANFVVSANVADRGGGTASLIIDSDVALRVALDAVQPPNPLPQIYKVRCAVIKRKE